MPSFFIAFQRLAPQHLLSRVVGFFAESRLLKRPFISWFKNRYQVDLSEALIEDPNAYKNFNDFFTRELKPGARPINEEDGIIVSPADGAISQIGRINDQLLLQAKGKHFSVASLLACDLDTAAKFSDGNFVTVYLSPKDYHRVHMPIAGKLEKTTYVPGKLFSVNQQTAESVENLFAVNERLVCHFKTDIGPMALVLVGAMIVAGIETVWSGPMAPNKSKVKIENENHEDINLAIGQEMGRFKLGSTAIVLLPKDTVEFNAQLQAGSAMRMGEKIATQI